MPVVNHTLLVIDQRYRVHSWAVNADWAQREADRLALPGNGTYTVIDLASTDVSTLARIAAEDCPALLVKGTGILGAGTHPAAPYLEVMLGMRGVTTGAVPGMTFGHDRVADIINVFLSNVGGWRGETARAVKAALKVMGAKR